MPQQSSETKDKKPGRPLKPSNIENMALSYLGRFATTTAHFRKIMIAKIERRCQRQNLTFSNEYKSMLEDVIERFEGYGYLNDRAYIDSKIKGGLQSGQSLRKIQSSLYQKGVAREEIEASIARYKDNCEDDGQGDIELKAAVLLMRKKRMGCFTKTPHSSLSPEEARKEKERFYRRMAGAGFSYDIVNRLYDIPLDEAESLI